MTKHIFITGGVVSSLGKGLTAASLGMLLEARGLTLKMQKLDPYLNIDPGTMSPYQHGEVYVLDDGSETDLDLGHYERFTNSPLSKNSSWTTGKIYRNVLRRERRGEYLGKTVQVIPHITGEIKRAIRSLAKPSAAESSPPDIIISEIGGTVGDIESLPFLEAIRQFALYAGRENCLFIHLTLIPFLKASAELKTKPTQHSVGKLREIGIQPDILICRTTGQDSPPLSDSERTKIGLFCNLDVRNVIEERDAEFSIYEVPLTLHKNGLDQRVIDFFWNRGGLVQKVPMSMFKPPELEEWYGLVHRLKEPKDTINIAVVGKYAKHKDAYKSIYEALTHAGVNNNVKVNAVAFNSEELEENIRAGNSIDSLLADYAGILVPGGFGDRGIEGKIAAIQYARENNIPFFGICLGMQCAVVEFARHAADCVNAHSTEFNPATPHPVITLLDEQRNVVDKGGTMRLGAQPAVLVKGSLLEKLYGTRQISERHRHRFELNNDYRQRLTEKGLRIAATSPDETLVEAVEIPNHPWFTGVQYHPEFKSRLRKPHPLFDGFVAAAVR